MGDLTIRSWRVKLYAPALDAAGLRPEDLARARRAFRAAVAEPSAEPVSGFALLRVDGTDGGLALAVQWWEGAVLHRLSLLIPGGDAPPRRAGPAGCVGIAGEILLMARELRREGT